MLKKVTVIFPTYNEKGNIGRLIIETNKVFHPDEIVVVDDNSQDGTIDELKGILQKTSNLKIHINTSPLGLAKSIEKGIKIARNKIVAWMDADFSHPPKILNQMYSRIENNDIVIASWLCQGGRDNRNEFYSVIRSILLNRICQLIFGRSVTAYSSGYAMINMNKFVNYKINGNYGEYFINLIVWAQRKHLRICEVPFTCMPRKYGTSKTNSNLASFIGKGILYIKMILVLSLDTNSKSKKTT